MSATTWLRDIGSFAVQLAVIIAAGAAIWRLLGVRHPVVTLAFWRVLLLACLLLPALQPWRAGGAPPIAAAVSSVAGQIENTRVARAPEISRPIRFTTLVSTFVLAGLAAGVATRGLWLLLGAWNLRRLRRSAVRLEPVPLVVREAEARIGVRADVYVSDCITGPITFGLLRPVVMVPPSVLAMETALQEAIASHELLHVRRRDWLSVIVEEIVRTVFWFHPGIWWLIGRIQLSREHVVDEAVICLTQSRDRYVEALIAVARAGSPLAPIPAPLFLRRRFLKKRVAQILQETTMTVRRVIASVTVSAAVLAGAAVLAVRSFPLEAHGQLEPAGQQDSAPVQVISGQEHLLHAALPEYPPRAIENRIEGVVLLTLTLDDRGEVSDARVVSGPDELRRAALESVLQWHYSPESVRSTSMDVALQFRVPPTSTGFARFTTEPGEPSPTQLTERQIKELENDIGVAESRDRKEAIKQALAERRTQLEMVQAKIRDANARTAFDGTRRLAQIKTERVPSEIVKEIRERAGISLGDPITEDLARRIREIATSIDVHLRTRFETDDRSGVVLILIAP